MPRGRPPKKKDEFVVVTSDQDVYFFDEESKVLDFLNETGTYSVEEDERRNWDVLLKFPVPSNTGNYCPMGLSAWRANSVIVLWNGVVTPFLKRTITKRVISYEYASLVGPKITSRRKKSTK